MMKKQIFSLMLSAAIFTTSPLLSMDPPPLPDNEGRSNVSANLQLETDPPQLQEEGEGSTHLCSSCNPELRFADVKDESKGFFSIIPNDVSVQILETRSFEELLVCSTTSKAMHNLCQTPHLWIPVARKYSYVLKPNLCTKFQCFSSYFSLFSQWNDGRNCEPIRYNVSPARFKTFLKTPCPTTWWAYHYEKTNPEVKSYQFSLGKDQYELYLSPEYKGSFLVDLETRTHDIVFFSAHTHGYKDATSRKPETIFNVFAAGFLQSIWIKKLENKK